MLNIDAPEIGHNGFPTDCLAEATRGNLTAKLPADTQITLACDKETTDRYGRDLAAVFVGDRLIIADIAAADFAKAIKVGENYAFLPPIKEVEQQAATNNLGIFNVPTECVIAPSADELSTARTRRFMRSTSGENRMDKPLGTARVIRVLGFDELLDNS